MVHVTQQQKPRAEAMSWQNTIIDNYNLQYLFAHISSTQLLRLQVLRCWT